MDNHVKPLKKFGQNYLKDKNILKKIVDEIDPKESDNIIEIGPGTGSLTEELLTRIPSISAVEIDTRVIENLKERFGTRLNLIREDIIKTELRKFGDNIRIAGNIPYNLTSPIIFKLIENNDIVKDAVLLVQLEVAQRMVSKQGTKEYGILAVLLNYFADVNLCFKVSPNVFYPKPKVYSAIVHLRFRSGTMEPGRKKVFMQTVKAGFGNRRKTIKNSFSNSIFKDIDFSSSGIDLSLRAEQLSIAQFVHLSEFVYNKLNIINGKNTEEVSI